MIVLVLGKIDSGKSSFCTYLANKLVNEIRRVAVLDGDLGQSDIGPSGTIGYALTSQPVTELPDLKLENAYFVGVASPILEIAKTIEGFIAMETEILEKPVDAVLVNTDGWVTDEIAVKYKTRLVNELKPDVTVGVQVEDELAPLIANIEKTSVITVGPSAFLKLRSSEKRKILREMSYSKYLKGAKLQSYPASQLAIEGRLALPENEDPEKDYLLGCMVPEANF